MIEIKRTYDPARGLKDVEQLSGYVFSPESFAHKFIVARSDEYGFEGTVSGRFLRADGLKIVIADVETAGVDPDGSAYVILTPECYQVPGRFLFLMLHTINSEQSVIYAATSSVLDAEGTGEVIAERSALTLEEQLRRVMVKANNVALFAQNVGDIESQVAEYGANTEGILAALAEAEIRPLNKPNLLSQQWWEISDNQIIIFGEARRWYWSGHPFVNSLNNDTEYTYTEEPADKGDAWYREIDSVDETTGAITYKDIWHVFKDEDEIRTSRADLGESGQITDSDGEIYRYALQFDVTGLESGYNNSEDLVFNYGSNGGTRQDGTTYGPSGVLDMVDGETYTLSCWARITSGTQARLCFAYGYHTSHYESYGNMQLHDISNTTWQRVTWTFIYRATDGTRTFHPRVSIGVCRKYTGTVQLTGFRLTKGGLYGSDSIDTLKAQLTALTARVAALEQANGTAAAGNLSASAEASPLSGETGDQTNTTEEVSSSEE